MIPGWNKGVTFAKSSVMECVLNAYCEKTTCSHNGKMRASFSDRMICMFFKVRLFRALCGTSKENVYGKCANSCVSRRLSICLQISYENRSMPVSVLQRKSPFMTMFEYESGCFLLQIIFYLSFFCQYCVQKKPVIQEI